MMLRAIIADDEPLARERVRSFLADETEIKIVADDFIGTSSSGKTGDKGTLLAEAKRDTSTYTSAVSSDMTVKMFGPTVAVVTGVAKESGKTKAGKIFTHSYRFTDTWVERNGEWQCVAAHAMALPKK